MHADSKMTVSLLSETILFSYHALWPKHKKAPDNVIKIIHKKIKSEIPIWIILIT